MTQVQEERVEVAALKSDYQFGFHDPDQSVFRSSKGLNREIVAACSELLDGEDEGNRNDA